MSAEYDKLRAVWYKKLKTTKSKEYPEGFSDIESDDYNLKVWSSKFAREPSLSWEAKAAYYQMATNLLNDYKFKSNRERIIWEYHTNGISCRNIAKILNKLKKTSKCSARDRMRVWRVIERLEDIMMKMYMNE